MEKILLVLFMLCALVAIMTTVGIVMSVLFESIRFFGQVSPVDFLFGTQWSPQTALRADQVASEGAFGAIPLFMGTLLISAIALLVAVPVGLMSAIYLAEYARQGARRGQAVAGDPRRCADRGLRLFRGTDRGAVHP